MERGARVASLCLLLAAAASAPAQAGSITLSTNGGFLGVPVTSIKEARFATVIKQQYDFSCGSAAVASLLTYHYGRPTTEQEVFREMWEVGDQEKIRKLGFSLLDMKRYFDGRGLRADGYQIGLDKLAKAGVPAITLIDTNGYKHFVLVKGFEGDEVLVGDPALGMNVTSRAEFEAMWNGIVFVIREEFEVAREHFNQNKEWRVRVKAPFGTALSREGLANFIMLLPGTNTF